MDRMLSTGLRAVTIRKWFFQCLKCGRNFKSSGSSDEHSRFARFRNHPKGPGSDSDKIDSETVEAGLGGIRGRQNLQHMDHPVGLLYGILGFGIGEQASLQMNSRME